MNLDPAARAAIMEYNAAMRGETLPTPAEPQPEAQPEPPALPAHALALYPWLAKHAHTARLEPHVRIETGKVYQFVTVTV